MKFIRSVKGCTRLDTFNDVDIMTKFNMEGLNSRVDDYKKNRENV